MGWGRVRVRGEGEPGMESVESCIIHNNNRNHWNFNFHPGMEMPSVRASSYANKAGTKQASDPPSTNARSPSPRPSPPDAVHVALSWRHNR